MRLLTLSILMTLSLPLLAAEPVKLDSERDRVSYSLGYQLGSNYQRQGVEVDAQFLLRGIQDGLSGTAERPMSEEDMRKALQDYRAKLTQAQRDKAEQAKVQQRAAGKDFLEANKKKEGVVTLASGLQYKVLKEGTGQRPGPTNNVTVHYRGTLINGEEFDSSYKRNQPATFPLNGVIPGWTEGLQLMQEGAKYQLYIPAELAYGESGRLANQTLLFEVELLAVQANTAAAK